MQIVLSRRRWVALGTASILAGVLIIVLVIWLNKSAERIPANVKKQVSFIVFYPNSQGGLTTDKSSFKFDQRSKLLTFNVRQSSGSGVAVVSEQATPDQFVDIPQTYSTLLNSLNLYKQFDSVQGSVALVHPKELKGQQSAALNAKGTFMLVHPIKGYSLSEDQWRQFFNNLDIVK